MPRVSTEPEGLLVECAACNYYTWCRVYKYDEFTQRAGQSRPLCELCASTESGTAEKYPEQFRGTRDVMAVVCYVGNMILDAIKKREEREV